MREKNRERMREKETGPYTMKAIETEGREKRGKRKRYKE